MKARHCDADPRRVIDVLEREDKERLQNNQNAAEKLSRGEELDFIEIRTPEEIHICYVTNHDSQQKKSLVKLRSKLVGMMD